ncbi:hypothetical protein K488DRAFT_71527 [Vararia minispora EC-137]|uniref:Uncharacterized protein n=1 Tax=Vararia minispora EC-137 TaxID=1314806 RepID=A0ACB8QI20_9AGAM|nr:hypothetical protein K488DRAFT_71527 [Vararia minispora EC-137]
MSRTGPPVRRLPQFAKDYFDTLFGFDTRTLQIFLASDGSYQYLDRNRMPHVLDYHFPCGTGTVVPQHMWEPLQRGDRYRHVQGATLQCPIFFKQRGTLGIPLQYAAGGYTDGIESGNYQAPLGDKTTTHLSLSWPGYNPFRQQVEIKDSAHRPITIAKLAEHHRAQSIGREDITIVGLVHVSAGTWMPIIRLNRGVLLPPN